MGILNLRRRRTALAAGLATVAMAVGLSAVPAQAVDKTKYIALGDSFAAGQGAGPYRDDVCYRSENAYSELAAGAKAIKLVTNAACSGRTTQDVVNSQLRQLNNTTELVTITAGGNNLGFGDIITNCGAALRDPVAAGPACQTASAAAAAKIASGQLAGEVASMIQSVQAAAPNAKIVVTGYPYLYDPVPLDPTNPMSAFIYQATDLTNGLNWSIAQAVLATDTDTTDVQFVDVRAAFAGHGILSTDDPWINGATGSPDGFHPNAKGYLAYYTALNAEKVYSAP
ncbi:lysophospholipase L1-like esterase [Arthrobacter ginsengisoli]|uniref:Lysophospholipase L1-like esterase n=1 Tax=Arthrobacter ginsengisoli TaxID=1356565 RepID=A0ABU1UC44_9MICC|nr:SGNH/GDSL hydrolase family protein [Arthrobacter ginsengisoli]MDR7082675.1 lysophospholipase L1-like esterase [Arthrobacter ginsengisoli]